MSKLYFKYGATNCGKTASLLQMVHNYESRNMKVLVLKPKIDTKGDNKIVSRVGLERDVDHLIEKKENIYEYLKKKNGISCIFVDEAQFLETKQVEDLLKIVVNYNIPVICFGLRTDLNTKGFEGSTRLLEIAHSIEEMKTICDCGAKAIFNARMVNGEFVFDGEQVAIDGENEVTYESLCAKCYYKKKDEYKKRNSTN